MKMKRKWEFIHNTLKEIKNTYEGCIGFDIKEAKILKKIVDQCNLLMRIANEFDDFLNENYDRKYTLKWKKDWDKIKTYTLKPCISTHVMIMILRKDIIENDAYCPACLFSYWCCCDVCKFGQQFGNCLDDDSEFQRFVRELDELEYLMQKY